MDTLDDGISSDGSSTVSLGSDLGPLSGLTSPSPATQASWDQAASDAGLGGSGDNGWGGNGWDGSGGAVPSITIRPDARDGAGAMGQDAMGEDGAAFPATPGNGPLDGGPPLSASPALLTTDEPPWPRPPDVSGGTPDAAPSLLSRVYDALPTQGQVVGAGKLLLGSAEELVGTGTVGLGLVATGAGVLTTPEGVGVPLTAGGLAMVGAGVVVARQGQSLAQQGVDEMFPPPGAGVPMPMAGPALGGRPNHTGAPPPAPAPSSPPASIPPQVGGFQESFPANAGGLPTSTGSPPPDVRLGDWQEASPTGAPVAPTILESRRDPSLTQPTGPIGGVPSGPRSNNAKGAEPDEKAQVDSENQVGDRFAAAGYKTTQNPTVGPNPVLTPKRMTAEGLNPARNPDLLIEDRVFDTYTPVKDDANSIRGGIAQKINDRQTHRVVVDLRNTTQTESSVRAALRANPISGLKEVVTVTDSGIGRFFRP